MSDFGKRQWQADEAAREAALEKQRERDAKARARSRDRAQRRLAKLAAELEAKGELSDFEEEFAESVSERLETFGAAFRDPAKGAPGSALSTAQKRVLRAMEAKAKGEERRAKPFKHSSFKRKAATPPRGRDIHEDDENASGSEEELRGRPDAKTPARPSGPPVLTVIPGGLDR